MFQEYITDFWFCKVDSFCNIQKKYSLPIPFKYTHNNFILSNTWVIHGLQSSRTQRHSETTKWWEWIAAAALQILSGRQRRECGCVESNNGCMQECSDSNKKMQFGNKRKRIREYWTSIRGVAQEFEHRSIGFCALPVDAWLLIHHSGFGAYFRTKLRSSSGISLCTRNVKFILGRRWNVHFIKPITHWKR